MCLPHLAGLPLRILHWLWLLLWLSLADLCYPLQDLNEEDDVSSSRVLDEIPNSAQFSALSVPQPAILAHPHPLYPAFLPRASYWSPYPMWRREKDTATAQTTNNAKNPPPVIVRCLYRGGQGGSVVGLARPTQPYLLKPKELCDSIQGRGLFKMLTI